MLGTEIQRVRGDEEFTSRARELFERDEELLERLGRWSAEQITGVMPTSPKVGIEPAGFPLATGRALNGVV